MRSREESSSPVSRSSSLSTRPPLLLETAPGLLHHPQLLRYPVVLLAELDLVGTGQAFPEGFEPLARTAQPLQAACQLAPPPVEFLSFLMDPGPPASIVVGGISPTPRPW